MSPQGEPEEACTDADTCDLAGSVIMATGANSMYLGLESEERLKQKGVSGCVPCDGRLYKGKDVVVGGGDAAAEEALLLSHICVNLVHHRDELSASLPMKKKVAADDISLWGRVPVAGTAFSVSITQTNRRRPSTFDPTMSP